MNSNYLRNPTTKLVVTNYNTGCARPTAVAPKPLGLWRCFQGKSWRLYLYFAYKSGFKRVRAILKAVEAVKLKLWCFKGIVKCKPNPLPEASGLGNLTSFSPSPLSFPSQVCWTKSNRSPRRGSGKDCRWELHWKNFSLHGWNLQSPPPRTWHTL